MRLHAEVVLRLQEAVVWRLREVVVLHLRALALWRLGQWDGARRCPALCVLHPLLSGGQATVLWFHAQARS